MQKFRLLKQAIQIVGNLTWVSLAWLKSDSHLIFNSCLSSQCCADKAFTQSRSSWNQDISIALAWISCLAITCLERTGSAWSKFALSTAIDISALCLSSSLASSKSLLWHFSSITFWWFFFVKILMWIQIDCSIY